MMHKQGDSIVWVYSQGAGDRFARIRTNLTSLDNQPYKAALVVILFLVREVLQGLRP